MERERGKDNSRMTNRHFQTYRWEKHIIAYNSDINQATEKWKKENYTEIDGGSFFSERESKKKTVANETAPAWCWIEVQICMLSKSKVEKNISWPLTNRLVYIQKNKRWEK